MLIQNAASMATRPRGGGGGNAPTRRATSRQRSGAVRPVYETFKPRSEWNQDSEFHILSVHLPGFIKEQLKVSTEGHNTIRVHGERHVADNKWSQFTEDFEVPRNGRMSSVRAKFRGGVLIITVLKTKPDKPQITDDQTQQPVPEKGQDPNPQTTSSDLQKPSDNSSTKPDQDGNEKQQISSSEAQNAAGDPNKEHDPSSANTTTEATEPKGLIDDQKKDTNGKNESTEGESSSGGATGKAEKTQKQESYGTYVKKRFKNAIKGITELDEERKLLVNMGAAVLVIMTVTAYVTYKFSKMKT